VKQKEQLRNLVFCATEDECKLEFKKLVKSAYLKRKSEQAYFKKSRKPFDWG
jgi:hypothetical protein